MQAKHIHTNPDLERGTFRATSGRLGSLRILDYFHNAKHIVTHPSTTLTNRNVTMGKDVPYPKGPLLPRRLRLTFVAILFISWSFFFSLLSSERVPFIMPSGTDEWLPVRKLTCTDTFWDPAKCGMDGINCDQTYGRHVAFQCPANCLRDGVVKGKPHLAGSHEITNQPLVIGGPIYRGDSYICPAAIHAGVSDESQGGCGVAKYMGMTNSFSSSYIYDVESIDVQTYFPLTFRFTVESEDMACPPARDSSWTLPYVSAAHTALLWRTSGSRTTRTIWALVVAYGHLSVREAPWRWWPAWSSVPASAAPEDVMGRQEVPFPKILEPEIHMDSISNITFKWAEPVPSDVDGISMLVDDVERARRFFGKNARNKLREGETATTFFWQRTPQAFVDFIRFGYIKNGKVLKYSQPGIWFTNGTWTGIPAEA